MDYTPQTDEQLAATLYGDSATAEVESDVVESQGAITQDDSDGDDMVTSVNDIFEVFDEPIADHNMAANYAGTCASEGITRQQSRDIVEVYMAGKITAENYMRLGAAKGLTSGQTRMLGRLVGYN